MGRIVRRDGSTAEASSTETKNIQTEAASDPSVPAESESLTNSPTQTTDVPSESAHSTAPVETNVTPTIDTTALPEPTTLEQQPKPNTERPTETQQPANNNNDPSQAGDNTTQDYSAEATSLDNSPLSALPTQASLAVTSSTLPASVVSSMSSSSAIVQYVNTPLPCPSSISASNSICANTSNNSSQSQLSGGAIAGIVVGAIAALAIICGCLFLRRRRHSRRSEIPPRQRSFLFTEEKPVFESAPPSSDIPSDTSVYQSQNTFGVHQDSQVTIPKHDYAATTLSSQTNEFNKEHNMVTGLYPPMKRDKSNEYMQHTNRMSVAVDTDNYTLSAMKLFQPPSRTMSPSSTIRDSQISNYNSSNSELQSKRSIYRPSLHQSQIVTDFGHHRRESTIDPYNNSKKNKPLSLWDDSLKPEDDSSYSYNPNHEWTHDNGYIQPPLYRP